MSRGDVASSMHPDDRDAVTQLVNSAANGQPLRTRYRITLADGAIRHLEAIGMVRDLAAPIARRQMFGVLRDVTDEIAATRLQLEKDAAERVAQARTEFLSRLSHELRTPLNAVLGLAQVLEMDTQEPLGSQQRRRVELILESGWHLLHLVDDVLDITSIDSGMLTIKPAHRSARGAAHQPRAGRTRTLRIAPERRRSLAGRNRERDGRSAAIAAGVRQPAQQCLQVQRARRQSHARLSRFAT
jgi:signal transduction histidine kinase